MQKWRCGLNFEIELKKARMSRDGNKNIVLLTSTKTKRKADAKDGVMLSYQIS